MSYFIFKTLLSGIVIAIISEIAKTSSLFAAIIASLPITSIFALTWLYLESGDIKTTSNLAIEIFWLVIPSLFFFIAFPSLLKYGVRFVPALLIASISTSSLYWIYLQVIRKLGVPI